MVGFRISKQVDTFGLGLINPCNKLDFPEYMCDESVLTFRPGNKNGGRSGSWESNIAPAKCDNVINSRLQHPKPSPVGLSTLTMSPVEYQRITNRLANI